MTTDLITLPELEQYLAKAADLLRGSIDQADFKAYIFPLMFFKRISDVYDEEFAQALEESGGDHEFAAFAENHRFPIPDGQPGTTFASRTENIGQAPADRVPRDRESQPDTLYGIFGDAHWTNKDKLAGRASSRDLIEHFSTQTLSNAAVAPDVFGNAYEYLIKRFADQSNKKAGEFYTPRSVVRHDGQHPRPQRGRERLRPGLRHRRHADRGHRAREGAPAADPKTLWGKLFGQEKIPHHLRHRPDEPAPPRRRGLQDRPRGHPAQPRVLRPATGSRQFDCVIANPPFSLKDWGEDAVGSRPVGPQPLGGVPPQRIRRLGLGAAHGHLAGPKTGRVAVVLPQGALFRQGAEARIRKHILKTDLVEAVIGLAPNLFYGTGLAACVLVLRQHKQPEREGKVLFIDGERLFKRAATRTPSEPEHAAQLLDAYEAVRRRSTASPTSSTSTRSTATTATSTSRATSHPPMARSATLAEALADLEAALRPRPRRPGERLEAELAKWGLEVAA